MNYKVLKMLLMITLLTLSIIGCGDTEAENASGTNITIASEKTTVENTEEENVNIEENTKIEDEEVPKEAEPTYTETEELVLLDNVNHNLAKAEDKIDVDSIPIALENKDIVIIKEVSIYYDDGLYAGYAKVGARSNLIAYDDSWHVMTFVDGTYFVKTNEFSDAMMLASEYDKQNQVADSETSSDSSESSENTSEGSEMERPEVTYTVTDISKTMYAKQSVNVRRGPSSDFERLGGLSTNQEVTVTGQADTGWYRIAFNGGEAFVSNSYLSDNRVEVSTTPNTGNNVPDSGSHVEVPSQPEIPETPSTPSTTYSEAEVIAIVESTLRNAGMRKPEEEMTAEELAMFGPTGGMGWGISEIPMDDPQTAANSLLEGAQWRGYTYYYIESLGVSNGCVTLKIYGG